MPRPPSQRPLLCCQRRQRPQAPRRPPWSDRYLACEPCRAPTVALSRWAVRPSDGHQADPSAAPCRPQLGYPQPVQCASIEQPARRRAGQAQHGSLNNKSGPRCDQGAQIPPHVAVVSILEETLSPSVCAVHVSLKLKQRNGSPDRLSEAAAVYMCSGPARMDPPLQGREASSWLA